jgi:hypothetical protein
MPEEPLTLSELQVAKDTLGTKAHHLREVLHELRRTRPGGWRAEFSQVQAELIAIATAIGRLERRIRAAVEGEPSVEEEGANDA